MTYLVFGSPRVWFSHCKNNPISCFALVYALVATGTAHGQAQSFWQYQIRQGDTLIGIAKRQLIDGQRWPEIRSLNGVTQPRNLKPGASLRIPMELTKVSAAVATAVAVNGKVERQSGGAGDNISLKFADQIKQGDRIVTGANSSLKLEFIDGSYVQLQRDTAVVFKLLQGQTAARISSVQMMVEQGRVETLVKPLKGKLTRYEVLTPTVQIGVRGTNFRVNFDPAGSLSRSEVLDGAVNARNDQGSENIPKDFGTLIPPNAAPLPPIPLLPAPGADSIPAQVDRLPVSLKWESVAGASQYRALLATTADFSVIVAENIFATPVANFGDLADGRYFLRVRAIDGNGLEGKNAERAIDIKARPTAPFLEGPRNNATVRGDKPELRWARNDETNRYHVQLAADADFHSLLLDATDHKNNKIIAPTTVPPGEYFWRVASKRANGDRGPFSEPQKFVLKAVPMLAEKDTIAPAIDDQTLTLAFRDAEPGRRYRFQIARSRQFNPVLKDATLPEPRIVMPRPSGRELYMRVQIIDSDGFVAPFSEAIALELPPQSAALLPAVLQGHTLRIAWSEVGPRYRTRLQIARDREFEYLQLDQTLTRPYVDIYSPAGGEYFLRSALVDDDGFSTSFGGIYRVTIPSLNAAPGWLLLPLLPVH